MNNKKIIIANWKMNLSPEESLMLAKKMVFKFKKFDKGDIVICPDFLNLKEIKKILKGSRIKLGAQDVFWENKGSFTGEISSENLIKAGCNYVIIGHSERRKYVLENYEMINKKIKAVINSEKLTPIVCIGENWDERKTNKVDFVLADQLQEALGGVNVAGNQKIIIAYEPIWAIGSGTAMEPQEAEYSHKIIKLTLNNMYGMKIVNKHFRIIYGGSLTSKIVKGFSKIDYLDGLLVGGASLKADEFYKISEAIAK